MESPSPSSTLTGSSATFTWYPSNAAQAYWIDVGSTLGGNNYYQSGSLPTTTLSQTVTDLPTDGSTIYVTLWTQISGQWLNNQYIYTAFNSGSSKGVITSPTPGSTLTGSSELFTWTGFGCDRLLDRRRQRAGRQPVLPVGQHRQRHQLHVSGLPTNGSTVYVTLYSLVNGQWLNNQYTYTAYNLAGSQGVLTTPDAGFAVHRHDGNIPVDGGRGRLGVLA